jgi:hypothetical protein
MRKTLLSLAIATIAVAASVDTADAQRRGEAESIALAVSTVVAP